jgi:CubicO group peptidase (beta-lactamase class C family)
VKHSVYLEGIAKVRERAQREIDSGLLPSCQIAVARDGQLIAYETLGNAAHGSRYAIFSCAKVIVASAVWLLLGEEKLRLEDRVVDHVPEFGRHGKEAVTVEHLLTYRAGLPRAMLERDEWTDRALRIERFAEWRLEWQPGSHYEYHYTSAHWVLAELIERLGGMDFRRFLHERVLEPLGLRRLRFGVPAEKQGDINRIVLAGEPATPEELFAAWGVPELFAGEVNDAALVAYNDDPDAIAAGVPGGGAVSTAADLALFYQALLHNPGDLWKSEWLADGTQNIRVRDADILMAGRPANRTTGVIVAGDDGCAVNRGFGRTVGPRAFGHGGVAGQLAWADPDSGLSFVYLTNGRDRHLVREARRGVALSSLAAVCGRNEAA